MHPHRPAPATVISLLALFVACSGTTFAATGGTFVLGRPNSADAVTRLRNTAGTALALTAPSDAPPLSVSNTVEVPRLNAALVGGFPAERLGTRVALRRATGPTSGHSATQVGQLVPWGGAGLFVEIRKRTSGSCLVADYDASNFMHGASGAKVHYGVYVARAGTNVANFITSYFFNTQNQHQLWSSTGVFQGLTAGAYRVGLFLGNGTAGATIATDANDTATLRVEEVTTC